MHAVNMSYLELVVPLQLDLVGHLPLCKSSQLCLHPPELDHTTTLTGESELHHNRYLPPFHGMLGHVMCKF